MRGCGVLLVAPRIFEAIRASVLGMVGVPIRTWLMGRREAHATARASPDSGCRVLLFVIYRSSSGGGGVGYRLLRPRPPVGLLSPATCLSMEYIRPNRVIARRKKSGFRRVCAEPALDRDCPGAVARYSTSA